MKKARSLPREGKQMPEIKESPLLEVKDLKQYFNIPMGMFQSKPLKAVDGVSFTIDK